MKKTATIRARITPDLKRKAKRILEKLGMSPSDAINIFFSQIVLQKKIPFEIDLEKDDIPENYRKIKDINHFNSIIGLK